MKKLLTAVLCLIAAPLFAANPSFQSFNTNQFDTAGNQVSIKSGPALTNLAICRMVSEFGPLGAADDSLTFQTALNYGGCLKIPVGRYTVTNLFMTNNTFLDAQGATLVLAAATTNFLLDWGNHTNIIVQNLRMEGLLSTGTAAASITNGNRHGMRINMAAGAQSVVELCEAKGFSGFGFYPFNTNANPTSTAPLTTVRNLQAEFCFKGFYFDSLLQLSFPEYTIASGLFAQYCRYGINPDAGNLMIADSMALNCDVGLLLESGANAHHGIINAITLNHNAIGALLGNVVPGETIADSHFLVNGVDIVIRGGTGIVIDNCQFRQLSISSSNSIPGIIGAPFNVIQNCSFNGLWTSLKITNTDNSLYFVNCNSYDATNNIAGLFRVQGPGQFSDWSWLKGTNITIGVTNIVSSHHAPGLPRIGGAEFGNNYPNYGLAIATRDGTPAYFLGRDGSFGYFHIDGEQAAAATGVAFAQTNSTLFYFLSTPVNGLTIANCTSNMLTAQFLNVPTNVTPFTITTTDFVQGQIYTNVNQRSWVSACIGRLATTGVAWMVLRLDQNGDGTFEQTGIHIANAGLVSATNQLSAFVQPLGRFVFTNLSSGDGTVSIAPGSSQWVKQ